jgi:hypothetical protein
MATRTNARALRFGESLPFVPTGKLDALGDLEQEIALASEQFLAMNTSNQSITSLQLLEPRQSQIKRIRKLG